MANLVRKRVRPLGETADWELTDLYKSLVQEEGGLEILETVVKNVTNLTEETFLDRAFDRVQLRFLASAVYQGGRQVQETTAETLRQVSTLVESLRKKYGQELYRLYRTACMEAAPPQGDGTAGCSPIPPLTPPVNCTTEEKEEAEG